METLFTTTDTKARDSKGRFATPERAYAERAKRENQYLKLECERYKRAYFAAVDDAADWKRKYLELREKLESIIK